jgi:hypothetical protein
MGDEIKEEAELIESFHENPLSEVEEFLLEKIPSIVSVCGLGRICFYFRTVLADQSVDKNGKTILSINFNDVYKTAKITIFPAAIELYYNGNQSILIRALIHEISHIVTFKLGKLAKERYVQKEDVSNSLEEVTESFAQIAGQLLSKIDPKSFS